VNGDGAPERPTVAWWMDRADSDGEPVGGVHIKYLLHCPRQLWLYIHGYRPEDRSNAVAFGEAIDDTTYTRRRDIDLDEARIDWVTTGVVVHETKSSRTPSPQHEAQARHYCLLLERRGIHVRGGVIHYPHTRRTVQVTWDNARPCSGAGHRTAGAGDHRLRQGATPARPPAVPRMLLHRLLLGEPVTAAARTYWLTEPCRIRRENDSVRIERADASPVRVPITDISDLIAFDHVDINTSVISLLSRNGVTVHLLDHYGNYAGALAPAGGMSSAEVIRRQVALTADPGRRLAVARVIVAAAAGNVRWALDTALLDGPLTRLGEQLNDCGDANALMGLEGNFRRTAWGVLDTMLPPWLRLAGRSRRPPANAGNAFISYANAIIYARVLTALRCTPLQPALGFLHSDTDRRRNTLALDIAEPFKPLFAERILKRAAAQRTLHESDFESSVGAASLTRSGRKKVATLIRAELATTVYHRALRRKVTYDELLHLEALKLVRLCLEDTPYKPFRPWW
jgi:CRISP-associated protein Cas1